MTFDPSKTTEHTVPEVVDAVTEQPGLAADVLAAERARTDREPRATLIEKIEALQAAESTPAADDGDSAPDADSAAQAQPQPASGAGDGTVQTPEPALTGDGTPGQAPPDTEQSSRWAGLYGRATALDDDKRAEFDRLMNDGVTEWGDVPSDPAKQDEFERRLVLAEQFDGGAEPTAVDDGTVSRVTPDVEADSPSYDEIMAGEPMTDANRGSAPVTTSSEQPGAVIAE